MFLSPILLVSILTLFLFPTLLVKRLFAASLQDAVLEEAFWIQKSDDLDLSGLSWCNNQLITVSDKIDDTVFHIEFKDNKASLTPLLTFEATSPNIDYSIWSHPLYYFQSWFHKDFLDFEGISCQQDSIYLVSERKNKILAITSDTTQWLDINWYQQAYDAGYLQTHNAHIEGITFGDDEQIFLAIERQPRGLITIKDAFSSQSKTLLQPIPEAPSLSFRKNSKDVAGLDYTDQLLWTLERNASAICARETISLKPTLCISYRHIDKQTAFSYQDTEYGTAEGLAVASDAIYIIFDNNRKGRLQNPQDTRALLLKLKKPSISIAP